MRILHLCLASFYIDNNSYQENILPRMHKRMGHDVKIVASTETYINNKQLGYIKPSQYVNEDGIPVQRIPYVKFLPAKLAHKLRIYKNVYKSINDFKPDFIFIHSPQFCSIKSVKKYCIKHKNVKVVVDGHSDFNNSAKSFMSYRVLHKCIYKRCANLIEPYATAFYGTLPARVDFFVDVYKIPKEKVSLLPMGADDNIIEEVNTDTVKDNVRKKYSIGKDDFLIATGGKINRARPEPLALFEAVSQLKSNNVKLIFFGSVSDEYAEKFNELCSSERIINAGWQLPQKTSEFMAAADLVVFPGLHSVMWEQAVALGKPCIFRKLDGFGHVDIGGNALFIDDVSTDSLKEILESVTDKNCKKYKDMFDAANSDRKEDFLYSRIAEKSINI